MLIERRVDGIVTIANSLVLDTDQFFILSQPRFPWSLSVENPKEQ
jgi:hypothetical protein